MAMGSSSAPPEKDLSQDNGQTDQKHQYAEPENKCQNPENSIGFITDFGTSGAKWPTLGKLGKTSDFIFGQKGKTDSIGALAAPAVLRHAAIAQPEVDQVQTSAYIPPLLAINSTDVLHAAQTRPDLRRWRSTEKQPFGHCITQRAGKAQTMTARRRTSDFARLLPPNRAMAVVWPNKRMRNFMKNRIANMIFFGTADIKPQAEMTFVL